MAPKPVTLTFAGDSDDLLRDFEKVGGASKQMAGDIDRASSDSRTSLASLEGGVDASEGKFRAFGDTINGTGDIMEGFRTGNLAQVAMGFADLAGAATDLIIPALKKVGDQVKDVGAKAVEAVTGLNSMGSTSTLGNIALLGAKLAGVLAIAEALETVLDNILGMDFAHGPLDVLRDIGKNNPLGLPDFIKGGLKSLNPFGHTGGTVPGHAGQDVMMRLQAGETIIPRGNTTAQAGMNLTVNVSGVGMGRDFGRAVADALRDNKLMGVT